MLQIRAARRDWADWIVKSWFRGTWTANLVWVVRNEWLQRAQNDLALELIEHSRRSEPAFGRDGPKQVYRNEEEMYQHVIGLWAECSRLMHQICDARGIRYLHFLQPNQYHKGSKPLSEEELNEYFVQNQEYGSLLINRRSIVHKAQMVHRYLPAYHKRALIHSGRQDPAEIRVNGLHVIPFGKPILGHRGLVFA